MSLKQALDSMLSEAVDQKLIPGVVAIATDRDSAIYQGAFGVRSLGHSGEMSIDAVALLASMTKAITATAAMQLVERGLIGLDDPISQKLPALASVQVLDGFGSDGKAILRAPRRQLTLRHLLTHTSGFGYDFLSADIQRFEAERGLPTVLSGDPAALQIPLLFDPGARWEYGIGIDWVGRVIERLSGQTLSDYLSEHVLGPLGMSDTTFHLRPDLRNRLARIHARQADGSLVPTDIELAARPDFDMGGAGLYGTLVDYMKFVRMVLNGGAAERGRVLQAATILQMQRNQIGEINVPGIFSADPSLTNDLPLPADNPHKWGLAWLINTKPLDTGRPAGSQMWAGITNCYYWIDPANGIGGALMTQILPFADPVALPLFMQFEAEIYRSLR